MIDKYADTEKSVLDFIRKHTGIYNIMPEDDILETHQVYGDDLDDLMKNFALEFDVDMQSYLWYFHNRDEGFSIGKFIFKPPYKKVSRIPVTGKMLAGAVEQGHWDYNYPPHKVSKLRWDVYFDVFVLIVLLFAVLYFIMN